MPIDRESEELLREAARELKDITEALQRDDGSRADIDRLVAKLRRVEARTLGPRPRAKPGEGAKWQILAYLREHFGTPVSGAELAALGHISEWARRLRELRVEHGYDIREVGDSVYELLSIESDAERRRQWQVANGIRRRKGSGLSRIAALFEARVGEIVTTDEIVYVAKIKSAARRGRELRDERGWPINSHIDEPALRPDEYRLLSMDPADRLDPLQRRYPEELRQKVFERDEYTCVVCGRNREAAAAAGDSRFYLEIHHKTALADELERLSEEELNRLENLVTLCHRDHLKETAALQKRRRKSRGRSGG